jgi:hypothetical protein
VIAEGVTGPVQGRLVDRFGQRLLLLIGSLVSTVALAGLLVAVRTDASTWLLYLTSFLAGATRPQVGSFVRARWTYLLGRGRALQTAFALEAVGDEVVFIVGPRPGDRGGDPGQPVRRADGRRGDGPRRHPVARVAAGLRPARPRAFERD